MPIESILAHVGKSDPAFEIQTDIIFGGNVGAVLIIPRTYLNSFIDYGDVNTCVSQYLHIKYAKF